jgi:hypothetical protein
MVDISKCWQGGEASVEQKEEQRGAWRSGEISEILKISRFSVHIAPHVHRTENFLEIKVAPFELAFTPVQRSRPYLTPFPSYTHAKLDHLSKLRRYENRYKRRLDFFLSLCFSGLE